MGNERAAQGWYPDPAGSGDERYWDGSQWHAETRPVQPGMAGPDDRQVTAQPHQVPLYGSQQPGGPVTYSPPGGVWVQYAAAGERIAPFWWRVLAFLLDSALVVGIPWSIAVSGMHLDPMTRALAYSVLWLVYRTVAVGVWGATVFQALFGMRVVRDGEGFTSKVGWTAALTRALVAVATLHLPQVLPAVTRGHVNWSSQLTIGPLMGLVSLVAMLWPWFNDKRQALHDLVARTVVLKRD